MRAITLPTAALRESADVRRPPAGAIGVIIIRRSR
jgi:hypothetical protein